MIKKIIFMILCLVLVSEFVVGDIIYGSSKRVYYDCLNATSGEPLCSAGVVTCRDTAGNVDVNAQSLTNVETGLFYYTYSLANDTYSCKIGCTCAGAFNYTLTLQVEPDPAISDASIRNIELDTNELQSDDYPAEFTRVHGALDGNLTSILADTNELQGNQNWNVWDDATRTLTTADWTTDADLVNLAYQSNLTDGIVVLTSATEGQIDNIEADTNELQTDDYPTRFDTVDSSLTTIDNFLDTEIAAILADTDELQTNQGNWATAVGFSTHSAADVWSVVTRTLTALDEDSTTIDLDGSNVLGTVNPVDINSNADITEILGDTNELQGNQGNWATATGFSTHNESDVYEYFTAGSNEDVFKGSGTGATAAEVWGYANRNLSTPITESGENMTGIKAIGFSTHSAADVWSSGTRTLTTADWTTTSDLLSLAYQSNLTDGLVALTSATETQIDNIEADTNELQGNQGDWATATGFSTHSQSDVWAVATRTLTSFGSLVGDIDTRLNQSHSEGNWSSIGTGSSLTLDQIDTRLNSSHGNGNWTTFDGSGVTASVNSTEIWTANLTGLVSTRWTPGWYLDRIYRYP